MVLMGSTAVCRTIVVGQVLIVAVGSTCCTASAERRSTHERRPHPWSRLRDISKAFGGVHAVDGVSVNLYPGEVVGLLGHNGAGKSTLMKMLAGAYRLDSGDMLIAGEKVNIRSPRDAQRQGIETIYQTLALADNLDAVANLFLGRELLTPWRTLDDDRMEGEARKVFHRLNPNFTNIREPVRRCRAASARRWRSRGRSTSTPAS